MPKDCKTSLESGATKVFLGIDPGASGGFAVLSSSGKVTTWKMPATKKEVWDMLQWEAVGQLSGIRHFAAIEKVGGYMGRGVGERGGGAANGSAMFKFGMSYGSLRMALIAAGIPFEEVPPAVWQRGLGIPPRKREGKKVVESKSAFKSRLKQKAQQLFPSEKVTLATADALLIAEFCRRKHCGILK